MEANQLPLRPEPTVLQNAAEDLAGLLKAGNPSAMGRLRRVDRNAAGSDDAALPLAQQIIAREYGFAEWQTLADHVEALRSNVPRVRDFELAVDAIVTGDIDALKALLQNDPGLIRARSPRIHRATLLHYTAANGVEDFLQKTPKNIVAIAELLLKSGAEVDATADMYGGGATTLGLAVTSVHPFRAGVQNDLTDLLLQYGADINGAQGAGNGQPPINGCLANGRMEAAEHLAKRGARLDLEAAAGVGRLDVVKHFAGPQGLLNGATEQQLASGFKWACAYNRVEVVQYLLPFIPDINALHRGETPLHWAAFGGHTEIVRLLLAHKARADIPDATYDGTPLEWALYAWGSSEDNTQRATYYEIVELLAAAGARIRPEWLNQKDRGFPLDKAIAADPRMRTALGL